MTDNLTPEDRRKTMQAVKGKGTRLERQLAGMLAAMQLSGWRRNAYDIAGKPDVVFDGRLAIFIDGCFWHGCPHCKRKLPRTNRRYWTRKIQRNVALALKHNRSLRRQGLAVVRIWEHEMRDPAARAKIRSRIIQALDKEPHHAKTK
ncbi:MAG: very short patch repair endonuclease [Anaerolineae bacterium]